MRAVRRQSLGLLLIALLIFIFVLARFWKAAHFSMH